ncbi:MAG: adenosylcobinamide-GDP ribazoletransferase [Alistipes sp.]|jgi:adenosylcobinamide-GDP ribazoletransferase|nr:adenosylcobinamide-GDP ribazoletransferase [Alistipes sp.]
MFNDLLAALTLFTRLPLGRLRKIPAESFSRAVNFWPAVGLLTGTLTAGVLWCASTIFPAVAATVLAFGARTLFTGAFHEDGLGDFFDGFGGGRTRERTLEIMKDSHTGSYGVVGLVLYFTLVIALVGALPIETAVVVMAVGDPLSKAIAAQLVNLLPYARPAEQSKLGTSYRRMGSTALFLSIVVGLTPAALLLPSELWPAALAPVAMLAWLAHTMRRRIGGYTGDCCGAAFLLCEVAFYAGIWGALA